ncbi:MAG: phosphatidylglycerophosphatase A [Thalassobaculum sp.]
MSGARPSLASPAILIATGFGSGYLPKAPGTWGSLLAALLAWPLAGAGGAPALIAAAILATVAGLWAVRVYVDRTGESDPGPVVVDEFAGQWIALAVCPLDPVWWLAGFLVFRVIDIAKPFPAGWIDRNVKGPLGVMLDDLVAGVYSAALLLAAVTWI